MPLADTSAFGGVGFALGPGTNTFGTTSGTRADAETLRNTHFTSNSDLLDIYGSSDSLMIRLLFTGTPGVQYQIYVSDEWVDIAGVFEGPPGPTGAAGTDGAPGAVGPAGAQGQRGDVGHRAFSTSGRTTTPPLPHPDPRVVLTTLQVTHSQHHQDGPPRLLRRPAMNARLSLRPR